MMCEDCGIRPAKFHLMTIINGDRVERNLCPICMAKHQKQIPGIDFSNLAGILNSILENKKKSVIYKNIENKKGKTFSD